MSHVLRALVALGLAVAAASCGPPTPAGWTRPELADGAYSLAVPPGVECAAGPGTDSDVARCAGDGLDLALDWGTYGGVPPDAAVVAMERVDGRDVTLARDLDVLAVYFEAEPVDLGDGSVKPPTTLTLHVRCETEAACETARRIVRTVRF